MGSRRSQQPTGQSLTRAQVLGKFRKNGGSKIDKYMSEEIKEEVKAPAAEGGQLDEIEQQFGPYFIEDGKKVKPNQRAVVANFSKHHKTVFVQEIKFFLRYHPNAGIWEHITEHTLKRELGDYLRDLAKE